MAGMVSLLKKERWLRSRSERCEAAAATAAPAAAGAEPPRVKARPALLWMSVEVQFSGEEVNRSQTPNKTNARVVVESV